jgi:SNF2 family DNA or RNA helicase
MLFMQESDSEIQNQQARDRVYRIGSERHDAIRIIKQITPGTVEERQEELLATKKIRMEEVVRDQETLAKLLGVAA